MVFAIALKAQFQGSGCYRLTLESFCVRNHVHETNYKTISSLEVPMDIRRSLTTLIIYGVLFTGAGKAASPQSPQITTASLLEEMTDLAGMALFPSPAYTCRQFSSYDRASKSQTEGWFANGDCGQYLRVEERAGRKEHVMMDANGPAIYGDAIPIS